MKKHSTIFLLAFTLLVFSSCQDIPGRTFDTFEKEINRDYSINVTAYKVNCFIICDANYLIESVNNINGYRKEIYTFRNDDPNKIPAKNFIVKSKNFAYFWMRWEIGVTTNGGESWKIFNILEGSKIEDTVVNYGQIERINIYEDGSGKIFFSKYKKEKGEFYYLETNDFGKTWQKP